jgi:hydrogenase maturation protease
MLCDNRQMNDDSKPIRIVGIGNVLMGDDGLGPTTVKILESRYEFPDRIELEDGGTPGLDFLPYLSGARMVIVIDTVAAKGEPGTLKVYRDRDIIGSAPPPRLTPHQPGLREALMATELTDSSPDEMVLLGVIPQSTDQGTTLSEPVQAAVEPLIEAVVAELERLGAAPSLRSEPLDPGIWWS